MEPSCKSPQGAIKPAPANCNEMALDEQTQFTQIAPQNCFVTTYEGLAVGFNIWIYFMQPFVEPRIDRP